MIDFLKILSFKKYVDKEDNTEIFGKTSIVKAVISLWHNIQQQQYNYCSPL